MGWGKPSRVRVWYGPTKEGMAGFEVEMQLHEHARTRHSKCICGAAGGSGCFDNRPAGLGACPFAATKRRGKCAQRRCILCSRDRDRDWRRFRYSLFEGSRFATEDCRAPSASERSSMLAFQRRAPRTGGPVKPMAGRPNAPKGKPIDALLGLRRRPSSRFLGDWASGSEEH